MTCERAERLLDAYMDGELDLPGSLEVEEHLRDCDRCQQRLEERRALVGAIREKAPCFEAPGYIMTRIRARLGESSASKPGWLRLFQPAWASLSGALAAFAIAMLYFLGAPRPGLNEEAVADHVRSLQAGHLMDVASTDQHTVKPWFAGKLDYSPQVVDLASAGFPLIGGRLDVLDRRPVAAIVYQRRKHYINLFIWPAGEGASLSRTLHEEHGYRTLRWSKAGMNYLAVSDVQEADLVNFAGLVKAHTD